VLRTEWKEVMKMAKIAKIDVEGYFGGGGASLLDREKDINMLLLRLTVIVNSIADWVNEGDWDSLQGTMKRIEERVAKLEGMAAGNVERGPGG